MSYGFAGPNGDFHGVLVIKTDDSKRLGAGFTVAVSTKHLCRDTPYLVLDDTRELEYGPSGNAYRVRLNRYANEQERALLRQKLSELYGQRADELDQRALQLLNAI